MLICVTHVDAATGVPCFKEPMRKGPSFPKVKGFEPEWWDASRWPIQHPDDFPRFYGACDDDADTDIPGVIEVLDEETYNRLRDNEMEARLPQVVSARQLRHALNDMGLVGSLATAFEGLTDSQKSKILIEWEYATEFSKNSAFVKKTGELLGLTQSEINDIFVKAANIGDIVLEESTPE